MGHGGTSWDNLHTPGLYDQARTEKARIIADYVASMTDRYALLEYERIFETGPILV